jgi:uncharacterized metal-binding protein YceD (DUF177 family)
MGRRDYDIAFVGLKPGIHEYFYDINDSFFESFQEQDFSHCAATVKTTLDKQHGCILLKFEIGGKLELTCDRCGSTSLPISLWDEFSLIVKLVENPEEMNLQEEDPDVYYIGRTESHLHIADWIYEFINLSIPMQRRCSEEEKGSNFCNKETLALLEKMEAGETNTLEQPKENPIWKNLENLKKNLDN